LGELFLNASFPIECLEYFDEQGNFHRRDWSPADGMIYRSKRFDERIEDGRLTYTSLIIDARKEYVMVDDGLAPKS
jgi:predicted SAM-dependent methyltransferase